MRRARPAGFTLIEVMAAVFILGLFVAAISQLLTQASRYEGQARLQARAAELADSEMAKLEEGLARGAAPALGVSEHQTEDGAVRTDVTAFDAETLATGGDDAAPPGARAPAVAGSWLQSPQAEQTPPLLEIDVRVSWDGAPVDAQTGEPFAIRRRTFALNPAALDALSEEEAAAPGEAE